MRLASHSCTSLATGTRIRTWNCPHGHAVRTVGGTMSRHRQRGLTAAPCMERLPDRAARAWPTPACSRRMRQFSASGVATLAHPVPREDKGEAEGGGGRRRKAGEGGHVATPADAAGRHWLKAGAAAFGGERGRDRKRRRRAGPPRQGKPAHRLREARAGGTRRGGKDEPGGAGQL